MRFLQALWLHWPLLPYPTVTIYFQTISPFCCFHYCPMLQFGHVLSTSHPSLVLLYPMFTSNSPHDVFLSSILPALFPCYLSPAFHFLLPPHFASILLPQIVHLLYQFHATRLYLQYIGLLHCFLCVSCSHLIGAMGKTVNRKEDK